MRESAGDEKGHTEEEWEVLAFAGKGDCCGHDESTSYGKDAASEGSKCKTPFENGLRCLLKWHWGASYEQGHQEATDEVAEEDEEEGADFSSIDEACCTCVELQRVMNNGEQTEGEEYGSYDVF